MVRQNAQYQKSLRRLTICIPSLLQRLSTCIKGAEEEMAV
jgi:hypothetical protein